ncbi:MAG: PucC family protein [Rhodobacteraceae bacterium]|nr:PucC family protein [Paracoccaceae bacterium]
MILRRRHIARLPVHWMPFADAVSPDLPLRQLLRLSLFQISVGMTHILMVGTLNRVMIVELDVPAALVALMIALPILVAPARAVLGFRSDTHRSAIGWKRIPYLWFGSLWLMGGLAIMPFALIVLSGDQTVGPAWAGEVLAGLAFLMCGLGMGMTQTAGLALATDRATEATRPRVVALLYVMLLLGMALSSLVVGWLLRDFTPFTLIRVVQGCAAATMVLNLVALWRQERVAPMSRAEREAPRPRFADAWADLMRGGRAGRLLAVVFTGTLAFQMQDVLLEPYGGQILGLSVSSTTFLTATLTLGALAAFILAARRLAQGRDPMRVAALGILAGIAAFAAIIFAGPTGSVGLFFAGAALLGFGSGFFAVSTLTYAMGLPVEGTAGRGLALGAWGAAQATALGLGLALGGFLRDGVGAAARAGWLGAALDTPVIGYSVVYHIEIALLFFTLVVLAPLVRQFAAGPAQTGETRTVGIAEFPT